MFRDSLLSQAEDFLTLAREKDVTVATAESCTGGLLSALLTEIPGASAVFDRGFVTYSNVAKMERLEVPETLLATHGAVSEEVARAMAEGALKHSPASLSVSITGIAGPGGATAAKPLGLIHFACAMTGKPTLSAHHIFSGNRSEIRLQAVQTALGICISRINKRAVI